MTNSSFLNDRRFRGVAPVDCRACAKPLKCCAFQPFLPNFLVGGWLANSKNSSLPELRSAHWHPIGLIPAKTYREAHARASSADASLRCTFYDFSSGSCGIYAYRPSECVAYFCDEGRFDSERVKFSQDAFDRELAVAQMALVELGLGPREIREQVDLVNEGTGENSSGLDLIFMYKKAWSWSQTVSLKDLENWMVAP